MNTTTEDPAETEATATMNNCVRPPHFPPHCGCPAAAPAPTDA